MGLYIYRVFAKLSFGCLSVCENFFLLFLVGWVILVGVGEGVIEYSLDEVDTSQLKYLSDFSGGRAVRNSHNALSLAKLYPIWYEKYAKGRRLKVYHFKDSKKISVSLPKLRVFRKNFYYWLKFLPLPNASWVLLTLTLSRNIDLQDAWANIGSWVRDFLQRFRVYLRKVKKFSQFHYFWVLEYHKDSYPHIHIICSFPFIEIEKIFEWWVDNEGKQLSEFQGVDVKFIGGSQNVKDYLLKYLVKQHSHYWAFHRLPGNRVRVKLATLFAWYFRVRIFGMSKSLLKLARSLRSSWVPSADCEFKGFTYAFYVWKTFYRFFNISPSMFWSGFIDCGSIERSDFYLPFLRVVSYN